MSGTDFPKAPFVPPGAQVETSAQLEARRYNEALQKKVERIVESKKALFHTPLGLRSLFPTNHVRLKIKKVGGVSHPVHVDPTTTLQEAAERLAEEN